MKFFKKLKDNVVFAMNIKDDIPEHIVQEIKAELATRGNPVQEFNEQVNIKLGSTKTKQVEANTPETFFSEIIGYSDIKRIMMKCIDSSDREPVHVILDGPPASAKSMFLTAMKNKLKDAYYVDCTNATGPGMVQYLFENDVKFLLLDEVEKMSKSNQNVLLNVMETGILTSTKVKKTYTKEMNLSIYATTNDIDAISRPFRSRFMEFSLPQYTYEDFREIAIKLLATRYELEEELSLKIADTVWNKMGSKDVRDLLQIGKLSQSVDDVDFIAETLHKYKGKDEVE